jgi:LmbE family N-acetylglucosaminyl deacetylase
MDPQLNILAIGAHPDDIEILCGGTLARYAEAGHAVFMYHVTNGEKGAIDRDPAIVRDERRAEAIRSAAVIGATSIGGDIKDSEVVVDLPSRLKVLDVIRASRADVVLSCHPQDYHSDHSNVSRLVFEASYLTTIGHLQTEHPALDKVPRVYHFDTIAGIGFEPTEYVDISSVIETKLEMMRQHVSQLAFIKEHEGLDHLDLIDITGRYRGYQCGVRYAEGFIEHLAWPRGSTARILP